MNVSRWPPPFWSAQTDRRAGGCWKDECVGPAVEYTTNCVSRYEMDLSYEDAHERSKSYFKKGQPYTADQYKNDDPSGYAEMVAKAEKWLWNHPEYVPECGDPKCECVWNTLVMSDATAFPKKQSNGKYCIAFEFACHLEGTCMDQGGASH